MTNVFLKVNKDLFKLELDPTEILILAQVMEFITNTGKCFVADDTLAEMLGVSAKTVSRKLESLENKGFIMRETKNVKGKHGKDRKIFVRMDNIEKKLSTDNLSNESTDKMTIDNSTDNLSLENINSTDNLSEINGQNDPIKDKRKDKINIKENILSEEGTPENPIVVEKEWLMERHNEIFETKDKLFNYQGKLYKMR